MIRRGHLLLAIAAGALFGAGLLVAGMTVPARVTGFLDVRHWDPTLAFVMIGAIGFKGVTTRWIIRRGQPVYDDCFHLPVRTQIDAPLIAGAAIFGVGWGLAGLCPGPALVAVASGATPVVAFVAAMLVGMKVHDAIRTGPAARSRRARR